MYIIQGHLFLDIKMGENGEDFPIGTGNLEALYVIENINNISQMQLVFKDVQGAINTTRTINDGTAITITMGVIEKQHSLAIPCHFRVFSQIGPTLTSGGQLYCLNCIADAPKYIRGIVQKPYKGSSSDAIKQIAADCGMAFSGVPTNDSQTWLPARISYMAMARRIAKHGYVNDQSYMRLGLTKYNEIKYYNASSLITQKPAAALVMGNIEQIPEKIRKQVGPTNQFVVTDYRITSNSGILNYALGYSGKQAQQLMDGTIGSQSQVQATRLSNGFDLNRNVRDKVGPVKSGYIPPDVGNSHGQYTKSGYQNQRIKALFSNKIEIVLEQRTELNIFDIVYLQLIDMTTRSIFTAYTGLYFVEIITTSIFGDKYYEKLRLVNTGKNTDPNGDNV